MPKDDGRQHDTVCEWTTAWPQTTDEFEELVEAFQHRLVWHAFQRVGNTPDAEDIVQNVFLRAFAERTRLRQVSHRYLKLECPWVQIDGVLLEV